MDCEWPELRSTRLGPTLIVEALALYDPRT
jgi:hypothetical protein